MVSRALRGATCLPVIHPIPAKENPRKRCGGLLDP
jgi:hypothetical protein